MTLRLAVALLVAICAFAAVLGWRYANGLLALTETDVIDAAAASWATETGGSPEACRAVAGSSPDVWIEVYCGAGQDLRVYFYDRTGRLVLTEDRPGV